MPPLAVRFGELAEGRIFARVEIQSVLGKMTASGFSVWGVGERGNWRIDGRYGWPL